jgi:hypothetical protein
LEPLGLSIPDTGRVLGGEKKPLSRATIYRMIGRNELEAFRLNGRTLITTESIKARVADAPRLGVAA